MNFLELLEAEVFINSFKNIRILVVYKDDFKEISNLKKELRLLTKKYDDFYKRNNGFYNSKCEIFFTKENNNMNPFGTLSLFVENENEAKQLKDDILLFIEKIYKREPYFVVGKDFSLNKLELNKYEFFYEGNLRMERGFFPELYKNEEDAKTFIKENIHKAIEKKCKEIESLKEILNKYM